MQGQGPYSQNPYPYGPPAPPPPPSGGVPVWVWIALAGGVLGLFALAGIFAIGMMLGARSNHATASAAEDDPSSPSDVSPSPAPPNKANLPRPRRSVPVHEVAILTGCSRTDLATIESSIGAAIQVGAPTYNAGDFQGCYTTYDRAAQRLESALSGSCTGPVTALETGRANARDRTTPADRAWAMRDAFDGLVDVVERAR